MKLSHSKIVLIGILLFFGQSCLGMEALETGLADGISKGLGEGASSAIGEITSNITGDITKSLPDALGENASLLAELPGSALDDITELGGEFGSKIADTFEALRDETITTDAAKTTINEAAETMAADLSKTLSDAAGKDIPVDATKLQAGLENEVDQLESSATQLNELAESNALSEVADTGRDVEMSAAAENPSPEVKNASDATDIATTKEMNADALEKKGESVTTETPQSFWEGGWGKFIKESLGMGLVSGFVFLFPNWIMSAIQGALTKKAQLMSVKAPQYFGGMWLQIPDELINVDNPLNTIPVYSLVTNPDIKSFYGDVTSAFGQPGGLGLHYGTVDNNNYFVSSGNYDDCPNPSSLNISWGASTINGSGFASQMVHLNSGLEFLADGSPLNPQLPYRFLAGTPSSQTSTCPATIYNYLYFIGPKIANGTPFNEISDMFNGTGMMNTSGTLARAQGGNAPPAGQQSGSQAQSTVQKLQALGKKLSDSSKKTTLLDYKYADINEPKGSQISTWDRMSAPFNVGSANDLILSTVKQPTTNLINAFGNLSTPSPEDLQYPLAAQGLYVYQTANTPLAKTVRAVLASQTGNYAAAANDFYDYVVTLNTSSSPVPGLIPQVNVASNGANDSKPGYVSWVVNPEVKYLYSLVDQAAYDVTTGLTAQITFDPSTLSSKNSVLSFATSLGESVKDLIAKGPFTYGSYIVTIPPELQNADRLASPVYLIDPAKNNNKTTLEGGYADYVVPLNASQLPVKIPDPAHKYWASLVSSRMYNSDLTFANGTVGFNILSIRGGVYIALESELSKYNDQYPGEVKTCPGGSHVNGPLSTLYMEYDLNPFNKDLVKTMATLTQAIAQSITNSNDPIYGELPSTQKSAIAITAASSFVTSLQAAGLLQWLPKLSSLTTDQMNQIAAACAPAITKALASSKVTLSSAKPSDITTALSISKPAVAGTTTTQSVFAGLGATVKNFVPSDAAAGIEQVFDAFPKYAGLSVSSFQSQLCSAGLMPLGPYYFYYNKNFSVTDEGGGKSSAQPLSKNPLTAPQKNLQTPTIFIFNDMTNSHDRWKRWLMGQSQSAWLAFEAMGPFSFTLNGIPNVLIEPTSLTDIQNGDYVYQVVGKVPNLPKGDYYAVASAISESNAYTGNALEAFNPANPQPYLISLTTGTVYTRDSGNANVIKSGTLSNLAAVRGMIKSTTLKNTLNIAAQQQAKSPDWQTYTRGSRTLTIDPQDVQNNTYVYQQIVAGTPLPQALSTITDFFIGANDSQTSKSIDLGIPLDNNPTYIVSLVTGQGYIRNGGKASFNPLPNPGSLLNNLPGSATVRDALKQAIAALITLQTAPANKKKPVTPPAQYKLDEDTIKNLSDNSAHTKTPYLYGAYSNLKFYNNKYYAVTDANNPHENVTTFFDYSAQPFIKNGKSTQVGVLYDASGNPSLFYDETLLDIARKKAGVIVGTTQSLGVPNPNQPIIIKDCTGNKNPDASCTLFGFDTPLTASMPEGTYTLYQYGSSDLKGLRLLARFEPSSGTGYYIDMFSGTQYNMDGSTRIAQYPTLLNSTTKKIAAPLGFDEEGFPLAFAPDNDGNYQVWNYYAQIQKDKTSTKYEGFTAAAYKNLNFAVTPYTLDPQTQWTAYNGFGIDQNSMQKFNSASPQTFTPQTSAAAEQLRLYTYIGSGAVDSGIVVSKTKIGNNSNYNDDLVIAGTGQGPAWKVTRLFMTPVIEDAPEYLELKSSEATGSGVPFATDPAASTQYSATLFDGLVDTDTKAPYIAVKDTNGVHFYVPTSPTTPGATLSAVQNQLKKYVSLTTYGDVGIFLPITNLTGLSVIPTILNVPNDQTSISSANQVLGTGQFVYESAEPRRYFYQYQDTDKTQAYYRGSPAAYVDLRYGVLYDANGIPTGTAISYAELAALLTIKNVAVPQASDNPTKFTEPSDKTFVGQKPSSSTDGFLWYGTTT